MRRMDHHHLESWPATYPSCHVTLTRGNPNFPDFYWDNSRHTCLFFFFCRANLASYTLAGDRRTNSFSQSLLGYRKASHALQGTGVSILLLDPTTNPMGAHSRIVYSARNPRQMFNNNFQNPDLTVSFVTAQKKKGGGGGNNHRGPPNFVKMLDVSHSLSFFSPSRSLSAVHQFYKNFKPSYYYNKPPWLTQRTTKLSTRRTAVSNPRNPP